MIGKSPPPSARLSIPVPEGCTAAIQTVVIQYQRDGRRIGLLTSYDGTTWIGLRITRIDPRHPIYDETEVLTTRDRDAAIAFATSAAPS
jgi:hypothetical protein